MRQFVLLVLNEAGTSREDKLVPKKAVFTFALKGLNVAEADAEGIHLERYDDDDAGGGWGILMRCTHAEKSPAETRNTPCNKLELGHRKGATRNLPGAEDRLFLEWFCRLAIHHFPEWKWSFEMTDSGVMLAMDIPYDKQEPLSFLAPLRLPADTFEFWFTVNDTKTNAIIKKDDGAPNVSKAAPGVGTGRPASEPLSSAPAMDSTAQLESGEIFRSSSYSKALGKAHGKPASCLAVAAISKPATTASDRVTPASDTNCGRLHLPNVIKWTFKAANPQKAFQTHFDNRLRSLRQKRSCCGKCKTYMGCGPRGCCAEDHTLVLLDIDDIGRSLQRRFATSPRVRNIVGEPVLLLLFTTCSRLFVERLITCAAPAAECGHELTDAACWSHCYAGPPPPADLHSTARLVKPSKRKLA